MELLEFVATVIIDSNKGSLKNAISDIEEEYFEKTKVLEDEEKLNCDKREKIKKI